MHRDIKPGNIIRVNEFGDWKLCDYGFTKITDKINELSKKFFKS